MRRSRPHYPTTSARLAHVSPFLARPQQPGPSSPVDGPLTGFPSHASPDDSCSICMEAFSPERAVTIGVCKHAFHARCIAQWQSDNCAMCRQSFYEQPAPSSPSPSDPDPDPADPDPVEPDNPDRTQNLAQLHHLLQTYPATTHIDMNDATEGPQMLEYLCSQPRPHMRHLTCWNCGLTYLPTTLTNLHNLTSLDATLNDIVVLPTSLGHTRIRMLKLAGNNLNVLPASIGQMASLQELDLAGNQLASLPASISNLTALQQLTVSHNPLLTLPDLSGCHNLDALRASHTLLTVLPPLPDSLSVLRVNNTRLRRIDMAHHPMLNFLEAGQNPQLEHVAAPAWATVVR